VATSIGFDPRISSSFLKAGIGFGGSCFPKDIRALIEFSLDLLAEKPVLLDAVLQINENRPLRVVKLLRRYLGDINGIEISVLGLTFKPGTNDVRDTPALAVIRSLWRNGAIIKVHDPMLSRIDLRDFKKFQVILCDTIETCVKNSYASIFLTDWPEYKDLNISKITQNMNKKLIIDGRRIFIKSYIPEDVHYLTIGTKQKNEFNNFL